MKQFQEYLHFLIHCDELPHTTPTANVNGQLVNCRLIHDFLNPSKQILDNTLQQQNAFGISQIEFLKDYVLQYYRSRLYGLKQQKKPDETKLLHFQEIVKSFCDQLQEYDEISLKLEMK